MRAPAWIACLLVLASAAARAETPYERDQREQLEKAQREGKLSPQVQQRLRREAEWRQQHPGQPLPNAGQMQKLHQAETQANINAGFARMRAQRQAQLQHDYQASRAHQQSILDRQHVKWTPAQWQAWDRQYDQSQRAQADAYREGVRLAGEIHQAEREHDEQQRIFKSQH